MHPSVPKSPELDSLNTRVAECDRHHHFYHYKSSWMHLSYADALKAQGHMDEAMKQYKAAWFQDHQNAHANAALSGKDRSALPAYTMHIETGAIEALVTFEASLGWEADTSVALCLGGDFAEALQVCAKRHDAYHHHASGAHLARGTWFEENGLHDLAVADYSKALDLNGKNIDAIRSRARLYRMKDNIRLAEADEAKLKAIA